MISEQMCLYERIPCYVCVVWLRWVFIAARRLSLVAVSSTWTFSVCTAWPSCSDSSDYRAWVLGHVGFSSCSTWAPQLRLTGSRVQASVVVAYGLQFLHGMWNLPGPGIEPLSPALAGGLLSTVGKSHQYFPRVKKLSGLSWWPSG